MSRPGDCSRAPTDARQQRAFFGGASDGGYRYTHAYFSAGGRALTDKISGDTVLSDPDDYADARDFLWFLDVVSARRPDRTVTWKSLLELVETDADPTFSHNDLVTKAPPRVLKLTAVWSF